MKRIRRCPLAYALVVACATIVLLAMAACSSSSPRPSAQERLYVAPQTAVTSTIQGWEATGNKSDARALLEITRQPSFVWAAGQPGDIPLIRSYVREATLHHQIAEVVLYNIPDRDACGKQSGANNTMSDATYESWVDAIAADIGSSNTIVIVEPDSLPDLDRGCLNPGQATNRLKLLAYAMHTIGSLPHDHVFLDAGNPGMGVSTTELATSLLAAGIRSGTGFSGNVSNFWPTTQVASWSQDVEADLYQDSHRNFQAVIDTSRNGHGLYTGPLQPTWCNPPDRALGQTPSLQTGINGVYAVLWVKNPWASDGSCRGNPPAGQPNPMYAVGLADGNSP